MLFFSCFRWKRDDRIPPFFHSIKNGALGSSSPHSLGLLFLRWTSLSVDVPPSTSFLSPSHEMWKSCFYEMMTFFPLSEPEDDLFPVRRNRVYSLCVELFLSEGRAVFSPADCEANPSIPF